MLKLKKLEILGFKSFCDRQEMRFSGGGISAIVGPNGCGKSNISDSISWVLGERSAKTLRGTRMGDVIFSGARDRKPSGLATVSLTLIDPEVYLAEKTGRPAANGAARASHSDGAARREPSEITVTRKLYRSGESDYLINGKICRLRDIQELFMGTGLGPEHYAIIEQGRIGQILSSRPVDRRAVIEEAAGVTKFKSKRRLAELKLESARQNLNRVNDILQEVVRQVNSLKRQASRARRYEDLRAQWRDNLTALLAHRYREMSRLIEDAVAEMSRADAHVEHLASESARQEAALEENRRQEHSHAQDLDRERNELSQLRMEVERLRSRVEEQARTAAETERRRVQAEAEGTRLDERLTALGVELQVEQAAVEEVSGQVEGLRQRLAEKTDELARQQTALEENERKQEELRQQVLGLLDELSHRNNELAKMDEFLAGNKRHLARVKDEETQTATEVGLLQQQRKELETRIEQCQGRLDTLTSQKDLIQGEIAGRQQEVRTWREEADELRQELSRVRARRDSLEEILSHHAYTTEAVKNLFAVLQEQSFDGFDPLGILADFVEVDREYEKLTDDFLRQELEFVVVKDWREARQGVQLLHSDLQGFATFLVHPEAPVAPELPALGPESGVQGRLADHIRLTNGLSGSASTLLPRLRSCYVVGEEEAASRLAQQYPDLYFLLPTGRCYHGYTLSGGKKTVAGPLALKRELRELTPRLAEIEQRLHEVTNAAQNGEAEITQKTEHLEAVQAELHAVEKDVLGLEHDLRQLGEREERAGRRLAVARSEIERLQREAADTASQRQMHRDAITEHEHTREAANSALAELRQNLQASQAERARLAEEQTHLRTELATLEERRKAAWASQERVGALASEHDERRQQIARQVQRWKAEHSGLLADNAALEQRIAEQTAARERLAEQVERRAADLQAARDAVLSIGENLKRQRQDLDEVREQRSAIEVRLVELRADAKHLDEDCRRDVGASLDELPAVEVLEPEQLAEMQQRHETLTHKIENLGPVNVLALEEFEEAQQRMEFLDTQRQDLLDSIRDTQKAITEIDAVSRRKFNEAFEAINKNFRELFASLFGGGVGEMRLIESENGAEGGIDIVASPPGKRLQNVALLSGGEKSLTALALLMATFRYKPSPFCVLDEVDAALDEPNLIRFRRLLQDMSEGTQFILITHSKTTMEAAQTLYGVTMQEPGVSKLVSVRIADHESRPDGDSQQAASRQRALTMEA